MSTATNGVVHTSGVVHPNGVAETNRVARTNGVVLVAPTVPGAPAVIAVTDLTKDYRLAANVVHALRGITLEVTLM